VGVIVGAAQAQDWVGVADGIDYQLTAVVGQLDATTQAAILAALTTRWDTAPLGQSSPPTSPATGPQKK
jgi:hypothetical protein